MFRLDKYFLRARLKRTLQPSATPAGAPIIASSPDTAQPPAPPPHSFLFSGGDHGPLFAQRDVAVQTLLAAIPEGAAVKSRYYVEQALERTQWQSCEAAAEYLEDLSDAISGLLWPPTSPNQDAPDADNDNGSRPPANSFCLRGIENSGNTCYVDSLLFALFARMTAMDGILTQTIPGADLLANPCPTQLSESVGTMVSPAASPASPSHQAVKDADACPDNAAMEEATVANPENPVGSKDPAQPMPTDPDAGSEATNDTTLDPEKPNEAMQVPSQMENKGQPAAAPTGVPQPPVETPEAARARLTRALQIALVLAVNRLRKGHLVTRGEMRGLEAAIKALWAHLGGNAGIVGRQEDVAELFLILASVFRAPSLPLWQRIHHGAREDAGGDLRVLTERCLQIAMPCDGKRKDKAAAPVALEGLLRAYFFDNKVEQIRRRVSVSPANPGSIITTSASASASDEELTADAEDVYPCPDMLVPPFVPGRSGSFASFESSSEIVVDGWSMIKVLPFLAGENEAGEQCDVLSRTSTIMIPMILKRYYMKNNVAKRSHRKVQIPPEINFDSYTEDAKAAFAPPSPASSPVGDASEGHTETGEGALPHATPSYSLVLQSVICHLGETAASGHFITYVNGSNAKIGERVPSMYVGDPSQLGPNSMPNFSSGPGKGAGKGSPWLGKTQPGRSQLTESPMPVTPPFASAAEGSDSRGPEGSSLPLSPIQEDDDTLCEPPVGLGLKSMHDAKAPPVHAPAVPEAGPVWLRFDGMAPGDSKVQILANREEIEHRFDGEIAKNAYMLFYELRRVDRRPDPASAEQAAAESDSATGDEEEPDPSTSKRRRFRRSARRYRGECIIS